jgi:hypothetical protein
MSLRMIGKCTNTQMFAYMSDPFPETFYFFGDNDMDEWKSLFERYVEPPLKLPRHTSAYSFGLVPMS